MRSMIIDMAEVNSAFSHLNVTCYFDKFHEDQAARFRLLSGEDVRLHDWQGESSPTPKKVVDYLTDCYQVDSYYIVDSSFKSNDQELEAFLGEYGLSDLPFHIGEAPEQYKLADGPFRPGRNQAEHQTEHEIIPVTNCERIGEAPSARRLPEPLHFQKGRLAWFPAEQNGSQIPEMSYMKELNEDNTVTMKDGRNIALSDCWSTKKDCEQHIQKSNLLLTEDDLSFAEEETVSL